MGLNHFAQNIAHGPEFALSRGYRAHFKPRSGGHGIGHDALSSRHPAFSFNFGSPNIMILVCFMEVMARRLPPAILNFFWALLTLAFGWPMR